MKKKAFKNLLHETRIFTGGPKIVAIGGGTGLSVLLRGLKKYTSNITAIVTVADDGGGSGKIREDMGLLPPGDIRNCIMALANTEPTMEKIMHYRFKEGVLKGQSFGNLFIAALNEISGSFDEAIREISNVLAVTGKVLPVTLEDIILFAELEDGTIIKGESNIPYKQQIHDKKIERVYLEPKTCVPLPEALEAMENADAIIIGPGSLYTSIIPNLLVKDVAKSINKCKGIKIYVSNLMTQLGETTGYSLSEHINTIKENAGKLDIDYVIANNGRIPVEFLQKYKTENAEPILVDQENINKLGIEVKCGNFVSIKKDYLRHDFNALAEYIFELVNEVVISKDKKRILDYYYVNGKLKKSKK